MSLYTPPKQIPVTAREIIADHLVTEGIKQDRARRIAQSIWSELYDWEYVKGRS